jgi:hypothetical protein
MWVFGSFILLSAAVVVTLQLLDPSPVEPGKTNPIVLAPGPAIATFI